MTGTPQRGPNAAERQDKPVLFDYAYLKDPEACCSGIIVGVLCLGSAGGLGYVLLFWDFSWAYAPRAVVAVLGMVAVGAGLFGLWALSRLPGRFTIDEDGITFRRVGKCVRIELSEVTDSLRRTLSSAIIIESGRKRIVCHPTKRFEPCARYLTKRLGGLRRQKVLKEPWRYEPEEVAQYGDVHEFRHSVAERTMGIAIALFHLTGGLGFLALLVVDPPEGIAGRCGIAAFGVAASLVGVLLVRWTCSIFGRISVDETAITLRRFRRETRIDFDAVDEVKAGNGLENPWIRLRSGDKSIRVSEGIGDGRFLFHILHERVPLLHAQERVEVPYKVHASRAPFAVAALLVPAFLGMAIGCAFAPEEEGWVTRVVAPLAGVAFVAVLLVSTLKRPRRVVFDTDAVTVEYLRGTRRFDAEKLRNIVSGGSDVVLRFEGDRVEFVPRDVATSVLVRVLRNLYTDQLRKAADAGEPHSV